ncbi:ion transporter [Parasphingorhabdus cellanae]|uniref:Ion transporter n=1 Tax=Parasphingorhabdus cellanae TaxID=2806553 RepID=A0ABX7T3B2_9SPHN|nr:ion transporter [Parasphingorhabdus cellanae]QTD54567.1 ion transporter [Parasphingorhabdus cellanae]
MIESAWFQNAIMAVIVVNAVVIGLETSADVMASFGPVLIALDQIAIVIFVIEILLKLLVYRLGFFRSGWNIFDFVIVSAALLPLGGNYAILRALRIVRAFRLISAMPKMRQVVQGLLAAIPSMGSVILLLGLIFYVASVMATKLFGAAFPQWFGSVGASLYSLFQIMTLESWSMGIVRPIMEVYPWAWAFFVPFVLVTSFVVLNLFIAIIVNAMHEEADEEQSAQRDVILEEIRGLRQEVAEMRGEKTA